MPKVFNQLLAEFDVSKQRSVCLNRQEIAIFISLGGKYYEQPVQHHHHCELGYYFCQNISSISSWPNYPLKCAHFPNIFENVSYSYFFGYPPQMIRPWRAS